MSSATPQLLGSGTAFPGQSLQDEYSFNPNNQALTPPDAEGAVGPNHFAQLINGRFAVYTKAGTLVTAESLDQFWAGVQPSGIAVDPRILYDAHSGRWFASSRDTSNGRTDNDLLFAVSATNDPSGAWTFYKVLAGTGRAFIDYDTLGVDDNGVYFGMTLVDIPTRVETVAIFATPKGPLLSGGQVTVSKFYGITDMFPAPQAALNLDSVGPTDPAWFISSTKTLSGVAYRTLTWNGATPSLSTTTIVATPSYGPLVNAPSLGGTMNIETNDQRLLMAVVRNHQLWTARTVGVNSTGAGTSNPDRVASEFIDLGLTANQASLIQSGRVFDSATTNPRSYYFPSVAVNSLGYMVMGFSGSSAAEYVGAYATSRLPSDPLGALGPVTQIKAGEGAYTITFGGIFNRWGDYSTTSVDPTDDKTIWTNQEYAGATVPAGSPAGDSTRRWATWIASFSSPQLVTATAVSSSPNPSALGQVVTFTAAVTPPGSPGVPTGTVDFTEGGTDLTPGGVTLSGGVATFSISSLSLGSHTISAAYGGDPTFLASSGDDSAAPQAVRTTTTTTVSSAPNPSVFGQKVTFTAVVSAGGGGTPTGTVQFTEGSTQLSSDGVSLINGVATFATSLFSQGSNIITANYRGDGNFLASSGDDSAMPQLVNQASSLTAVASSPGPSVFGQLVTVTATVSAASPGAGFPSGSVDFRVGSTDLTPGGVPLSRSVATFATRVLSVGSDTITAVYSGDTNFTGSQGNDSASPQLVNQDASTTAVKIDVNPSVFGQVVTMTATVPAAAPGSGNPTGNVTFLDGSATLGTALLDASHHATFSTSALSRGNHSIRATYGGDGNFTGSTSAGYGETVNRAATTLTISSSTVSSVRGQPVVLTATISPLAPGSGIPTGTVSFVDGDGILALNIQVKGVGQATFLTQTLAVGTHTITATYNGDTNFQPSTGNDSAAPQVVSQDSTQTSVTSAKNTVVFGQVVTLTAIVRPNLPGSGVPSGRVIFTDFGNVVANVTLLNGQATASAGPLAMGNHSIKASYSGNLNFIASSSMAYGLTVVKGSTATVLQAAPNPSGFGNPVTLTAVVRAVAPASGVPTGMVAFNDGTTFLGARALDARGQATFSTASLSVGSHTISVFYGGDSHFVKSTSAPYGQKVTAGTTALGPTSVLAANQQSAPLHTNTPGSISTPLRTTSPQSSAGATSPSGTTASAAAPANPALNGPATDHFFASTLRTKRAAGLMKLGQSEQADSADWLGTV
jgi:hypothetical protein